MVFSLADADRALHFADSADRYAKNVAALQLLRDLQAAGRTPGDLRPDELWTLAHYTAFGESALLERALTPSSPVTQLTNADELKLLKRTALTAFYTPPALYAALWAALAPSLRALDGPLAVLEPAFGTGLAIATMPRDLRERVAITGVELDALTGQIASFLHPDVALTYGRGFETVDLPADTYDLVISNVPFGDLPIFDPEMEHEGAFLTRTIHDYFLARALLLTRPGGVVAVLSSYGTLEKRDARVRTWLAQRAELVGAFRLPQGVMDTTGGTASGADLILLRRTPTQRQSVPTWVETAPVELPIVDDPGARFTTGSRLDVPEPEAATATLHIPRHFIDHRDHVLGLIRLVRSNGIVWKAVTLHIGGDLVALLHTNLLNLAQPLVQPCLAVAQPTTVAAASRPRHQGPRAQRMREIAALAKLVVQRDLAGADASEERASLRRLYERFVRGYGPIHARANQQALRGEPELLFLKALETNVRYSDAGVEVERAAIFDRPTVRTTANVVPGAMTPDEALVWCLNDRGHVDVDHIAALCGERREAALAALEGRIFRVPGSDCWQTADEYLSGDIAAKMEAAKLAATHDPAYASQVAALEAVLPAALSDTQINARFGAPWIPEAVVADFITSIIPPFREARGSVRYLPALAKWIVTTEVRLVGNLVEFAWGTPRYHAIALLDATLNTRPIAVYDEDAEGRRVLDRIATLDARAKAQRIREAWRVWVWADDARTAQLCAIYNTQFNRWRRRDFNGAHLRLEGLNTAALRCGDLDPHQKDAVWMGLQQRAMLVHLPVGGGKTFIGLTLAHEWKRLGLASKPLIPVPNHLTDQWAAAANQLYSGMRVLAMSAEDFAQHKRGTFLSRIATEDWDAIICGHSSLGLIEMGQAGDAFVEQELAKLEAHLLEARALAKQQGSRASTRSVKAIERRMAQLETKLQRTATGIARDRGVILWEELGIDALIVDEAHAFKNLGVVSQMGAIPGIPTGNAARAFDLRMKSWDVRRRGGRVVLMTATPILNTLGEVFIFQTYLQDDVLEEHGIASFDAWAATFAETETLFELAPDGNGFRTTTRLCRFVNLPELFSLWFRMTFARSKEQLGLPVPTIAGGKPLAVSVPGSPRLRALTASFAARAERIKTGQVDPSVDNMLAIVGDGRKAALDLRMLGLPADEVNKIGVLADHVARLYHDYDDAKATQIIFCELGTPPR